MMDTVESDDPFLRVLSRIVDAYVANRGRVHAAVLVIIAAGIGAAFYMGFRKSRDLDGWATLAQMEKDARENDVDPAAWQSMIQTLPQTNVHVWGLLMAAERLMALEDKGSARQLLEEVLVKYPDHITAPTVHMALGRIYEDQGLYDKAVASYGMLAGRQDNYLYPEALLGKGRVLLLSGREDEAVNTFEVLASEAADTAMYWKDMARYYLFQIRHAQDIAPPAQQEQTERGVSDTHGVDTDASANTPLEPAS